MPLPALAAVAARVVGSAAVRSAAKTAGKAVVRHVATKAMTSSSRPGHKALSQHQFPDSPPWDSGPTHSPPPW